MSIGLDLKPLKNGPSNKMTWLIKNTQLGSMSKRLVATTNQPIKKELLMALVYYQASIVKY